MNFRRAVLKRALYSGAIADAIEVRFMPKVSCFTAKRFSARSSASTTAWGSSHLRCMPRLTSPKGYMFPPAIGSSHCNGTTPGNGNCML